MLDKGQQQAQAKRALAEAKLRQQNFQTNELQIELGGREGKDSVRYGDWELNGRAIDF